MKGSTVLLVVGGAAALGLGVLLVSKSANAQPKSVTLKAGCKYRAVFELKPAIRGDGLQGFLTAVNSGAVPGIDGVDVASTVDASEVTMTGTAATTHTLTPKSTKLSLGGKTMTLQSVELVGACP